MRRIKQRVGTDCGIACVAMIAGRDYQNAKRAFGSGRVKRTGKKDLQSALRALGLRTGARLVRCGGNYRNLPFRAILKTNVTGDGDWHWIVWDPKSCKTLDPLPHPYRKPKVVSYLRVYERRSK
jgi:hypothetical protein